MKRELRVVACRPTVGTCLAPRAWDLRCPEPGSARRVSAQHHFQQFFFK